MASDDRLVREVRVGERHDTRELSRNARRQAVERGLDDALMVDVGSGWRR